MTTWLDEWIEKNHHIYGTKAFVESSVYKDWPRYREPPAGIGHLGIAIMRGAKTIMKDKYRRKSGLAEELAQRYLRRIKFVGLTQQEVVDMERELNPRIQARGWYVHSYVIDLYSACDLGKPYESCRGGISVLIFRNGGYEDVSPQEYSELLKQRRAEATEIKVAMDAVEALKHKIEMECEWNRRDAELLAATREREKKARIAAVAKKNESLIALAMCEELGLMDGVRQRAEALAREDVS